MDRKVGQKWDKKCTTFTKVFHRQSQNLWKTPKVGQKVGQKGGQKKILNVPPFARFLSGFTIPKCSFIIVLLTIFAHKGG